MTNAKLKCYNGSAMKIVLDPATKRFTDVGPKPKKRKSSIELVGMKNQGYTLQEIADMCLTTREAVRQRIDRHYDKIGLIKPVKRGSLKERLGLLSSVEVAKRIGCSCQRLTYYRKQGIVNPRRAGRFWLYDEVEIAKVALVFQNDGWFYFVTPEEHKEKLCLRLQDPEAKEKQRLGLVVSWRDPKVRERRHLASITGREKISLAAITRWQDPEYSRKMGEIFQIKPNKAEIYLQGILDKYYPHTYKYVGDFQVNIGGRFPDFININGKKEVIELFGNYWHNPNEFPDRPSQGRLINHYKQYGYTCTVIWEEEFKKTKTLLKHIKHGGIYIPKLLGFVVSDYEEYEEVEIILDPITKKFSQRIKIINRNHKGGMIGWLKRIKRIRVVMGEQLNMCICLVRRLRKGF